MGNPLGPAALEYTCDLSSLRCFPNPCSEPWKDTALDFSSLSLKNVTSRKQPYTSKWMAEGMKVQSSQP